MYYQRRAREVPCIALWHLVITALGDAAITAIRVVYCFLLEPYNIVSSAYVAKPGDEADDGRRNGSQC